MTIKDMINAARLIEYTKGRGQGPAALLLANAWREFAWWPLSRLWRKARYRKDPLLSMFKAGRSMSDDEFHNFQMVVGFLSDSRLRTVKAWIEVIQEQRAKGEMERLKREREKNLYPREL